jgi:hypothetical protein
MSYSRTGRLNIIRKPGERCCADCFQQRNDQYGGLQGSHSRASSRSLARKGDCYVLKEDNDHGHGGGKSKFIRSWQRDNGLCMVLLRLSMIVRTESDGALLDTNETAYTKKPSFGRRNAHRVLFAAALNA